MISVGICVVTEDMNHDLWGDVLWQRIWTMICGEMCHDRGYGPWYVGNVSWQRIWTMICGEMCHERGYGPWSVGRCVMTGDMDHDLWGDVLWQGIWTMICGEMCHGRGYGPWSVGRCVVTWLIEAVLNRSLWPPLQFISISHLRVSFYFDIPQKSLLPYR